MKRSIGIALFFMVLGFTAIAHADLINNGGGFVYDTAANVTWYYVPDSNNGFTMTADTWQNAKNWASSLNVGGASGWSTGTVAQLQTLFNDLNTTSTWNAFKDTQGNNVLLNAQGVWSNQVYPPSSTSYSYAVAFAALYGGSVPAGSAFYAQNTDGRGELAIHAGDVAPVPIPASFMLLTPGLGYLAFVRRRIRRRVAR